MALQAIVKVTGAKQGKFKGDSALKSPLFADGITLLRFESIATAPRDAATGQASGKRQWQPIRLTKEWGASSPQFVQALTTNEILSKVVFEFFKPDPAGKVVLQHRVTLTNATVQTIDSSLDLITAGAGRELEDIELTFQSIMVENLDGKTSATDSSPVISAQPTPQPVSLPPIAREPIVPVIPH
jgi:type VI secretion system secreted protein Hcp